MRANRFPSFDILEDPDRIDRSAVHWGHERTRIIGAGNIWMKLRQRHANRPEW
jgi:hypothetical protein